MDRLKIAVIFGGCSAEYKISLQSAYGVITRMGGSKYEPIPLGISGDGEWFLYSGSAERIKDDTWSKADCVRAVISPDRRTRGILVSESNEIRTLRLDAAMPVLHGKNGEDGTVQGLLELAGIPVAGCKTAAAALGMDKDKAHKIAAAAGVRVPRSFTACGSSGSREVLRQAERIGFPLFVKPVKSGSSYGITKVLNPNELSAAIMLALEYDCEAIVEETVNGFEVGCSVLGNGELTVGAVDEIELGAEIPENGFFDYGEKYCRNKARIHVPARISAQKAEEVKDTAKTIYKALGCSGFARVDMFLTLGGSIVFNEVNTIPGLTGQSRFMAMLGEAGMSFEQVLDIIIESAVRG